MLRSFAGLALLAAVICLTVRSDGMSQRLGPSDIVLLYVGADDCAPCRAWQGGDGAAFRKSRYFGALTYREVRSSHLATLTDDDNWPDDIRSYRDRLRPGDGVPLWFVISGHEIVQQRSGTSQWRAAVLPTIRFLLAR